jgi:hypothetical protein
VSVVELDPLAPPDVPAAPLVPDAPEALSELEPPVAPPLMDALPLVDPDAPGAVALLLLEEPGVVVSIEVDEEELGEDGVVVAVGLDEVLVLVSDLLRSQPVTAAVATASTATRGMSLFMTSPFDCGCGGCDEPFAGPGRLRSIAMHMHDACQRGFPSGNACGSDRARRLFPDCGKRLPLARAKFLPVPPGRVGAGGIGRN